MPTLHFGKVWQVIRHFGVVFCNLVPLKRYLKIRHHGKYCYPIYFPIWLPQRCSRWTKKRRAHKKVEVTNVLIPWYPISYLTIASSGFFWGGALMGPYPTLRFGGACGRGVGAFERANLTFALAPPPQDDTNIPPRRLSLCTTNRPSHRKKIPPPR
jgi:hypothetical protein